MNKKTFFLFLINSVVASTFTGKVDHIVVRGSVSLIYVLMIRPRPNDSPSCVVGNYMVIKNGNSSTGKKQLVLLMIVQVTNENVVLHQANSCIHRYDGGDINIVQIIKKIISRINKYEIS